MTARFSIPVNSSNTNESSSHFNGINDHRGFQSAVGSSETSTNGAEQLRGIESDGVDSVQLLESGNQNGSCELWGMLLAEEETSLVLDGLGGSHSVTDVSKLSIHV